MSGGYASYPFMAKQLVNFPGEWVRVIKPRSMKSVQDNIIRAHRAGLNAELREDGYVWIQYPNKEDNS